ncbi:MAG: hypothetical protein PHV34_13980 [Verrucomicrobiae bacterium]|nr:hypothetical protein [Verrucomicrobiae bacterium]
MKSGSIKTMLFCGMFCLFSCAAWAGDASASGGPGPGKPLPKNSREFSPPDLTGLRERASYVADQLGAQSRDLVTLLAIIALIYAGYHAPFRGLEEFVTTILRMVMASALLASFHDMLPYFFDARRQLIGTLPVSGVDATLQVGSMIGVVGLGTFLMGPGGIALAMAIFAAALLILVVYSAQILFEALLIAVGPLAIACLAFRHSGGIFIAWLKTFIAALLIPVGWTIGILLGNSIYGWTGQSLAENATDFVACLIYMAAACAIYLGMPILTVWLVNKAGGAAAAAMPSPLQLFSSYLAGRAAISSNKGAAGNSATPSMLCAGNWSQANTSSNSTSTVTTQNFPDAYAERIRNAQKHHP